MASSTQKKTTTKKSGSRSGSRTAKGKQPQKRPIRREVGGVILLVLALCVLVSYCGVQAILIDLLAKLLKGLFGYGYWLAGPAMLLAGGILLLHRGRPVTLRTTCALLLPLLAGALFHTIFAGGDYALNGWGVLKNLWTAGLALKAGGAVSGLLAEAAVLLATAPKSNSAHNAIIAAMQDIERGRGGDIPRHLKNVHADSAGSEKPQAYKYPHVYPKHYVKQRYLPESLGDTTYYEYADNKTEQAAKVYWEKIKGPEG